LTYDWRITSPDGKQSTFSIAEPVIPRASPGIYNVRLSVSDGKASSASERTIMVIPLMIRGEVHHTELWHAHHVEAGHETEHAPKDFYAGERLLLRAVTETAPVVSVTGKLTATGIDGADLTAESELFNTGIPGRYAGELYDPRWASITSGLEEGSYAVRFRVVYANGVVKEDQVPLNIIGNVYENVGVHRRQ